MLLGNLKHICYRPVQSIYRQLFLIIYLRCFLKARRAFPELPSSEEHYGIPKTGRVVLLLLPFLFSFSSSGDVSTFLRLTIC